MRRSMSRILPVAGILATFGLFVVIAVLQSRWIAQLSEAELQRSRLALQESLRMVRDELNRELTAAYALLQFESGAPPQAWGRMTSETTAIWQRKTKFPGLVQRLLVVQPDGEDGALRMSAFSAETKRFDPVAWPAELNDLRKQLALPFTRFEVFGVHTFTGVALADGPVLVFPVIPASSGGFADATSWLVIELDEPLLLTKILPKILRNYLDDADRFDYEITREGLPEQTIFRSNPRVSLSTVDASASLLELGQEYFKHGIGGNVQRHQRLFRATVNRPGQLPAPPGEGGVWHLRVRHNSGSLAAASTRLRRSNLLLSFAMMALIAADLAVLALLARRAHRLGEARLEFAAAVSHELRTPVAAICSAADNLAAGVASEPSKVQQYGSAILNHGRQLADLVEQILAYASGQSLRKEYELEPLDLGQVITQSIAAAAPAARAAGVEIEEHIPDELPQVLGDAGAIQQALVNLLTNAIKYGAAGRWIGVFVRNGNANKLEISVEDKGRGIPSADLKSVFEPFFRGSASTNSQQRGAGLGLTIVKQIARAQSGSVTVASAPGRGSCFTLHLPTT